MRNSYFYFIFSVFCLCAACFVQKGAAGEEKGVFIESKTNEYSADYYLKKGVTGEKDKARTDIGIGETVSLELKGEKIGDPEKIEWTTTSSAATLEGNGAKAILKAHIDLKKNETVTVKAKTELGEVKKVFNLLIPQKIMSEKLSAPAKDHETGIQITKDGDALFASASAELMATIHPTKVSFSKIVVKEIFVSRAGNMGDVIKYKNNDRFITVSNKNSFISTISTSSVPANGEQFSNFLKGARNEQEEIPEEEIYPFRTIFVLKQVWNSGETIGEPFKHTITFDLDSQGKARASVERWNSKVSRVVGGKHE